MVGRRARLTARLAGVATTLSLVTLSLVTSSAWAFASPAAAQAAVAASPTASRDGTTLAPAALTSHRIAGIDRYATAAKISQQTFPNGAPVAVLASGVLFADALAGGPVAAKLGGPLLLTAQSTLPTATGDELARLAPTRVIVLGGTASIKDAVLDAVRALLPSVTIDRVSGLDRYGTAVDASSTFFSPGVASVYLVTGTQFPDGLSAAAAAVSDHSPILLVPSNSLPNAVRAEIVRLMPQRIVMLGGPGVVGPAVEAAVKGLAPKVMRVSGADRYGTSAAVAEDLFDHADNVFIASGTKFADALAGGVAAGAAGVPLVLTPSNCIPDVVETQLARLDVTTVTVLGGTASMSDAVAAGTSCGVPAWLTLVNQYRAAYGVGSVTDDAQGGGNAAAHIYYMQNTHEFGHGEDSTSPYYTASGASGGSNSDLSLNGGSGTALIDGWMAGPFHALALLRPSVASEALVSSGAYGALDLSYNWSTMKTPAWPLHWPSASMPDRLLTVSTGEVPSPTSSCPAAFQSGAAGLPLIASFGPNVAAITNATAALTAGGKALPVCVVDETNYTYSDPAWQKDGISILAENHSVLVIPQAPLSSGTTYQVSVHTNAGDTAWSFATA